MMTKQTEALKMAIEYLTNIQLDYKGHEVRKALQEVLDTKQAPCEQPVALLEALSDLEHQQWMKWAQSIMDSEPISDARKQRWATMMVDYKDLPDNIQEYDREWARKVMALYTHPCALARMTPTWQGLSDDEIDKIWFNHPKQAIGGVDWLVRFARAIEQALRERNCNDTK